MDAFHESHLEYWIDGVLSSDDPGNSSFLEFQDQILSLSEHYFLIYKGSRIDQMIK